MVATVQKIVPNLWFDAEAKEAVGFYTGLFPNSQVLSAVTLPGTPSGDGDVVTFHIAGYRMQALIGGPEFRFNPSISFILNFDPSTDPMAEARLRDTWMALEQGGSTLMPLDETFFSRLYGWVQDRYGLSWQLILSDPAGEPRPFVTPALLFVGDVAGRAEEAIEFYLSIFPDSSRGTTLRYPADMQYSKEGTVMYADFSLAGQWFAAMDSFYPHDFTFNEAVSLVVLCQSQAEIDYYWSRLSAIPEAEQCGWLKDPFGVSWQIVPEGLVSMMEQATPEQLERLIRTILGMQKLDVTALEEAFRGS
jgi:predicted 3-demethylubiquinone-9 3-methyltransferase (glyoxalase superfamily)